MAPFIHFFPKDGAGLECHDPARGNLHYFTGLGVPSYPGPLIAHAKITKTMDFDFFPLFQGFGYEFKYLI